MWHCRRIHQSFSIFLDRTDPNEHPEKRMVEMICEHAAPMNEHVAALSDQNKCMERQNGLRPIFVNYFKVSIYHRVKAVTFRRVLADHGYDIDQLLDVWNAKKSVSIEQCFPVGFLDNRLLINAERVGGSFGTHGRAKGRRQKGARRAVGLPLWPGKASRTAGCQEEQVPSKRWL